MELKIYFFANPPIKMLYILFDWFLYAKQGSFITMKCNLFHCFLLLLFIFPLWDVTSSRVRTRLKSLWPRPGLVVAAAVVRHGESQAPVATGSHLATWDEWVVFVLKSTFIIITIITPHKYFYCCKSVTNATGLHRIGSNVQLKICSEACSLHHA